MRPLNCLLVCLTICAASSASAERVQVERDSKLYAEPNGSAAILGTVKAGTAAEVVAHKAAWLQINTNDATGWLFSFNVRFTAAPGVTTAMNVALPKRRGDVTSTMGIRGIDEEDLRQARLDSEQLKRLDRHTASREQADASAQAAGLTRITVPYLDGK